MVLTLAALASVGAGPGATTGPTRAVPKKEEPPAIEGRYLVNDEARSLVIIERLPGSAYHMTSPGRWEGVGLFDGTVYWGVFRLVGEPQQAPGPIVAGTHWAERAATGSLNVTGEFTRGRSGRFEERWVPAPMEKGGAPEALPPPGGTPPEFGQYVYVEELPEAITKVPPVYPEDARRAGVEGTVMIQALVGKDGLVADARVVKSIPELDAAALASVRQWKFHPAAAKGQPVAVWVAIPVKFALH